MSKIVFNNSNNDFYITLKASVDAYFEGKKIKRTGDWRLYTKTIVLIAAFCLLYTTIMYLPVSGWAALGLTAILGFVMACIGFSVMHDANHGSYSSKNWVNEFMGLSLNFLGANSYFWKQKHNIIHHTYTNVDGIDDDIAKSPIIRQCETQQWIPAHKYQHIYLPFIYSLSGIFWIVIMDFSKYFGRKIYRTDAWKMSPKNHIIFWLTKLNYAIVYVAIPIYFWGVLGWLAGFLVMHIAMGITLSFVFQLAHVVEITEFEHLPLDETKHIESAWAEHQVKTTANFAMKNKVISWFVGGLNFQIEHHLFPRVSHIHYPAISKIVQEKCKEYNLPYNYYDTISDAIVSHFRVMRNLGKRPVANVLAAEAA